MTLPEKKTPFFILGSQRSGTTMLRLMINRHPALAVPHETGFMTVFLSRIGEYGDLSELANASHLLDDIGDYHLVKRGEHITVRSKILEHEISDYSSLIDAIMTEYAASKNKTRWGDKTPFYTADIDRLWMLFPRAKFIHLVRDGRDAALSQLKIEWMSNNLPRLATDWRWKTLVCHKVGTVLGPGQFLELRYEDLVSEPETNLRQICAFLDEPFDPRMLEHSEDASDVVPEISKQWHSHSVKAPDKSKLYGWKQKMSVADRTIFEQEAADALELFGYELENQPSTLSSKLKSLYYSTFKRW